MYFESLKTKVKIIPKNNNPLIIAFSLSSKDILISGINIGIVNILKLSNQNIIFVLILISILFLIDIIYSVSSLLLASFDLSLFTVASFFNAGLFTA